MNKIIAVILCLALVLGLAACGEADSPVVTPPADEPTDTPDAPDVPDAPEEPAAPETPAEPEAPAEPAEPAEPEPEYFSFTRENFPRMDGSTSLVPLAEAVASVLLGESREAVADLISFNRTTQSYRNLADGLCDIIIASEPNAVIYEEYADEGFAYEQAVIANDALIFVVNADNPVDNLTTEQIRDIYSGKIVNWSEVGGADEPITPFQRNSGAGSQALMEKLVMDGTAFMEAPADYIVGSMGGLMEAVKSYDDSAGAIGYSVYYYANDMKMAEGLKIISVDGVEPGAETIRSGAYPHISMYYSLIAADEPALSPARVMYEWLSSAEGQRLMMNEGYVSVMDF